MVESQTPTTAVGAAPWATSRPSTLVALAAMTCVALLGVVPHRIYEDGYLNAVSGVWAALADDAVHGVLYRPLISDLGYGGTRYFPLHIVLHALLTKTGLSLKTSGHAISVASTLLLAYSGFLGLSRRGTPRRIAWAGGVLALASRTAFLGAAGIRGDIFPLALGTLGLALTPRDARESVIPSAVSTGLAVLGKPTLVWAPAGAFLSLLAGRQVRQAVASASLSGAVVVAGLASAAWCSHGEMLVSFRAVGSGGGFSLGALLENLHNVRPGDLAWILGGLALTLRKGRRCLLHPFGAGLLVCVPVTLVLYTGAGIHVNHLIDPTAIGALSSAASFAESGGFDQTGGFVATGGFADRGGGSRLAGAVVGIATLLGLTEAVFLDQLMTIKHGELERAAAAIPAGPGPVLSEQPWIPLIAGERAFVIDTYSLQQMRRTIPRIDRDLIDRLDRCAFRAVVLLGPVEGAEGFYDHSSFGAGFRQHLSAAYSLWGIAGAHAIYLPRCPGRAATEAPLRPIAETETVLGRGGRPNRIKELLDWFRKR